MEGLDIVMFAPIGENCYTTDEYMNLKSFDRVYDFPQNAAWQVEINIYNLI